MDNKTFEAIFEDTIKMCRDTLLLKAHEYATDTDRLHNFQVASTVLGVSPQAALAGMMVKHTTSVYDLCVDEKNYFVLPAWDEKIQDHINYLILLRAMMLEQQLEPEELADYVQVRLPKDKGPSETSEPRKSAVEQFREMREAAVKSAKERAELQPRPEPTYLHN